MENKVKRYRGSYIATENGERFKVIFSYENKLDLGGNKRKYVNEKIEKKIKL